MASQSDHYRGHVIELYQHQSETGGAAEPELTVDSITVPHGRLPSGQYFFYNYAYDWGDDLIDLGRRFVDYRNRVETNRNRQRTDGAE
jgi:hypothetical protein